MDSPDNEHAREPLIEDKAVADTPPARKRSVFGFVLKLLVFLAVLAGAGGYAAIEFQDQDPRLKIVADVVEDGVTQARGLLATLTDGSTPAPSGKITTRRTPSGEDSQPETITAPAPLTPPSLDDEAVKQAQREADETVKAAEAKALDEARAQAEAKAQAQAEADAQAKAAEEKARAEAAEAKRIEDEQAMRAAAERESAEAEAKKRVAAATETNPGALTAQELISGLEGRIDELGEELKTVRERLDAPKNESRAAPEAVVEKPASTVDSGAAHIIVAYTLQRRLESGTPFAGEIAALSRLGIAPAALEALAPFAEKGAPTAAQLRTEFDAIAKKSRHAETGSHSGDLTDQLSKLVKVRPPGQTAPTSSLDSIASGIDAALARNDFRAAEAAFEMLPEASRTEAQSFGEALRARLAAEKAADALLHGAIASLGAK